MKKARRLQEERLVVIREQLSVGTTVGLVRKLIAVLETIEKLPVYLYDSRYVRFAIRNVRTTIGKVRNMHKSLSMWLIDCSLEDHYLPHWS